VPSFTLLDQEIREQRAGRNSSARGCDATTFERRSRLLEATRQHYVALLKQVLVDGKLPLWNDLDPGGADATTRNY